MDITFEMANLHTEYTGIPGNIQIFTKNKNTRGCVVKYFKDISQPEKYLTIAMHEFNTMEKHLNIDYITKNMILMFMMKNFIPIHMYYYHGINMNHDELSELFKKFKVLTPEDVNTCRKYTY